MSMSNARIYTLAKVSVGVLSSWQIVILYQVKYTSGKLIHFNMKPTLVADEMFPEGAGPYVELDEVGGSRLLVDLTASEKAVHADFFNDFGDLFDDDDLE
ncbi:COP9 signalosome complex subunit 9 isoform X2 [Anoplolepis gracilipes]|uniref:COP9 signalosome complex subunit 9 isoform X2 n=1 Tax=Anoplolepis gracilipes TaxID=354296 RepID=UPI003B9F0AFD